MSPEHIRIAELAKEDKERKFSSIAHLTMLTVITNIKSRGLTVGFTLAALLLPCTIDDKLR